MSGEEEVAKCDVDGCRRAPVVDLVGEINGLRCRKCLETDLGMRSIR